MLVHEEGSQRFTVQRNRLEIGIGGLGDREDEDVVGGMDAVFGRHSDSHRHVVYVLDRRTRLVGYDIINLRQGGCTVRQFDGVVQSGGLKALYTHTLDHQIIERADIGWGYLDIDCVNMRGLLVLGGNGNGHLRR